MTVLIEGVNRPMHCAGCGKRLAENQPAYPAYWFAFCDSACATKWADSRGAK